MGHYSRCPERRQILVLVIGLMAAGCLSLPRPVAATRWIGPVPKANEATAVVAVPASVRGPLQVTRSELRWTSRSDGRYAWAVELYNPSDTRLGATVVIEIRGPERSVLAHQEKMLSLAGGHRQEIAGGGKLSQEQASSALDWQIEYWVRVPPPPERRTRPLGN